MENLIVKYLSKAISAAEMDSLILWLEKDENYLTFQKFVKINYTIDFAMGQYDTESIRKELLKKIKDDKKALKRVMFWSFYKYVAILVIGLGIALFVFQRYDDFGKSNITSGNTSKNKIDNITLQLENGTTKIISTDGQEKLLDADGNIVGNQRGNTLLYKNDALAQKLVYNTLSIPYGKRFQIVLSDGTQVHLNAGSSLKYPIAFIEGQEREVFLKGEAYFDVSRNERHSFIVNADDVDITVLGTEFNVTNYPEDENINTVLVEGSVSLVKHDDHDHSSEATLLTPGEKGALNKGTGNISVEKIDTSIYTSWRNGNLKFRSTPFRNIERTLERYFNVVIENNYALLKDQVYTASFYDGESISDILGYIQEETDFDFQIAGNTITITPTK